MMSSEKRPRGRTLTVHIVGASRFLWVWQDSVTPDFFLRAFVELKNKKMETQSTRKEPELKQEVKQNSKLHSRSWDEWIKNETCFLSQSEINLIEEFVIKKLGLDGSILATFKSDNCIAFGQRLDENQKADYNAYKGLVIDNFLFSLFKVAQNNNKTDFMKTTVDELEISYEIKTELRKKGIKTLMDFFISH